MKTFKEFSLQEKDNIPEGQLVADAIETLMRAPHELQSVGNPMSDKLQAILVLRKNGMEDARLRERLLAAGHAEEEVAELLDKAPKADAKATMGFSKDLETSPKPHPDGE